VDPRERLRIALLGAGCARCGRPYPADGITVLAQRDEVAFVQLACAACQSQTLALVTGSFLAAADGGVQPAEVALGWKPVGVRRHRNRPAEPPPVNEADVQDMASFLAGYQGDVRGFFAPNRGSPDPGNTTDSGSSGDPESDSGKTDGPP
jgi:hypothetical protein